MMIEEEACRLQLARQMRHISLDTGSAEVLQYLVDAVEVDDDLWPAAQATLAYVASPIVSILPLF